jgi:hypothetical protein
MNFANEARLELQRLDQEIARLEKDRDENVARRSLLTALLDLYRPAVATVTLPPVRRTTRASTPVSTRSTHVFTRLSRGRGRENPRSTGTLGPADTRVLNVIVAKPNIGMGGLQRRLREDMTPNIIGTCVARLLIRGYIAGTPKTGPFNATGVAPTEPTVTRLASSYPRQKVTREEVIDTLRSLAADNPEGLGPQKVADKLQKPGGYIDYSQLQVLMTNLAKGGEIRKLGPGQYLPPEPAAA